MLAGGEIATLDASESWTIQPGFVWSFTVAQRFFGDKPAIPFLLVAGTFSGSNSSTIRGSDGERVGLHALDAKLDLSVGWTLGESWSPYLALRGFGGPVFWRVGGVDTLGTDAYHVSLALGYTLALGERVSLYFDGAPLGLRSLSGGANVRF